MDCITTDTALLMYYMEKKKFTKAKLSKETGLNRNTITAVFRGDNVSMPSLTKIVRALEIPPEEAGRIFFAPQLRIA